MTLQGSYANGFAPRDGQPLYPELWRGCVGAWAPCLGPTGLTLRDWSGFGNHGTLINTTPATFWAPVIGRYGAVFDQSNDDCQCGTSSIFHLQQMTISAWVIPTGTNTMNMLFSKMPSALNSGFEFGLRTIGGSTLAIAVAQFSGGLRGWFVDTTNNPVNTLFHVAAAINFPSGFMDCYINGRLTSRVTIFAGTVSYSASVPVQIGRQDTNGTFGGMIDDVRCYNRLLSQNEMCLLASRRGIAYDFAPVRRGGVFTATGFKAYWAARKAQIIGGGV